MAQYDNSSIAYYSTWPSRYLYDIANPPASTGYSVRLELSWAAGMQNYYQDLRFRDPATGMRCAYKVEFVSGPRADTVVEVLLYSGQTQLELLYGNAAAMSEESGADVFVEYGGMDALPTGWTHVGGTAFALGIATITGAATPTGLESASTYATGYAMRARIDLDAVVTSAEFGFTPAAGGQFVRVTYTPGDGAVLTSWDGASVRVADGVAVPPGYNVFEIRRLAASAALLLNGDVVATIAGDQPAGALPVSLSNISTSGHLHADWIAVRKCAATEPTATLNASGANPYYGAPVAPYDTLSLSFAFSSAVAIAWYTGTSALWSEQLVESYSVTRGMQDAMTRMSGTIDRHVSPAIGNFKKIDLKLPDHRDPDVLNRLFFGFVPSRDCLYDPDSDSTAFTGYDYSFFLSSRVLPMAMIAVPKGTDPGAWLKDGPGALGGYLSAEGFWPDGVLGRCMWNVDKIRTGVTTTPKVVSVSATSSVWQMAQKLADACGWIFLVKPREVGVTQSYTHDDPTYKIVRIEAEDYDPVSLTGYYDVDAANLGGAYRPSEGVDIEYFASEGGYNVGWIRDGEWLRYTVAMPTDREGTDITGAWTAKFRTAAPKAGRWFDVYWGTNPASLSLIERVEVDATGAYDEFAWNTDTVDLTVAASGTHYLKLVFGGAGTASDEHMNIGAIDLFPPAVVGDPTEVRPSIYFVDEDDIDSTTVGLDLPLGPDGLPVRISSPDDTLVSAKYIDSFIEQATAIVVRYKWKNSGTGAIDDTTREATAVNPALTIEGYVDHVETVSEPIEAATEGAAETIAQALADDLLDYYSENWGTVSATFTRRTDLQYLQAIQFCGYDGIPEVDESDNPYYFRITNIAYKVGKDGTVACDVTAMPVAKWWLMRRINRALAPDQVSEMEATIKAVLDILPPDLPGHIETTALTGPTVTVTTDDGPQIVCRGSGTAGDRVLCIWTVGSGYVAVKA
jgi:hypothetical protein